jgi:hypothetical protein
MQLTIFRSMRLIPFLGITLLLCHQFHAALVYRVYYNRFLGAVTLSFNDFGNIRTTAFEIDLRRFVPAFGGQRLPWDRNYDAARRLFGPSLAGKALRLIGRETYRQLFYYGESGGIWEGRHLKMIMNEGQRLGKPRLFNYAFTVGGALRFVEMGTFFTRDQVSKHSILANVEEESKSRRRAVVHLYPQICLRIFLHIYTHIPTVGVINHECSLLCG